ncbi:MAG: hypothetical protein AUJ51_13060 [Elusimicrobia bacterium CG1_02_56_21]|nr:MAG: hypothetical protein AUJ51_13060 [Elusimicrobia bacterium CG1_02_56_21]
MGIWDNAFKIPVPPEPTPEEKRMLDILAQKARKRSLGDVASFAVESTRPLHNLGAQGISFIEPLLVLIFNKEEVRKYTALLENSKAVSYLVDRLSNAPVEKEDLNVKKRP